jgi:hypothetical protein
VARSPENEIRDGNKFETPRLTLPTTIEVAIHTETSALLVPNEAEGEKE